MDAVQALYTYCGKCNIGCPIGGDKVLLKDSFGTEAIYWCKQCVMEDYLSEHNVKLSNTEFKRMSAIAAGRPQLSANGIAKLALHKLAIESFGSGVQPNINKIRASFAQGLYATAMAKFTEYVKHATSKFGGGGRELLELAAIHDFNPMISKSFAMRYACRQADCGLIPRAETDWFIAQQHGIAREYWFCAACGGEFKYSLSKKEVD